ncbi:MAG: triphosphoribosyl-dephospho-CoA synthase [Desulfurococcales archaeon]|nr:triphosphoribosyl-dephospho-CoA synthase [Desulfurococcales archaeon]
MASRLAAGAAVEAALHPKPGAVTPCASHPDKAAWDFMVHTAAIGEAAAAACRASLSGGDPLEAGLEAYARAIATLPLPGSNVGLGEALLLTPLAGALARAPLGAGCEPGPVALEASRIARSSGGGAAGAYYALLQRLSPSHLGRYEGPVPGVGGGDPDSMLDVLLAARWDHVHAELLEGYPRTLHTLSTLRRARRRGAGLGEAALEALLEGLAELGDTLILAKWGVRAYQKARAEAAWALTLHRAGKLTLHEALEALDRLWRPRRWNPGAMLDILAAALGLELACQPAGASTWAYQPP